MHGRTVLPVAIVLLAAATAGCLGDEPLQPGPDAETPTPEAGGATNRSWTDAAPTQMSRGEVGCGWTDATVLVAGGFNEGPMLSVTNTAEIYDLEADAWSSVPDLPMPLHHTHTVHVDGRFYVLGGYVGPSFTPTDAVLSWAPGEDSWTSETSLPVARGAGAPAIVGDRIGLVGGVGPDRELIPRVDVYNVTSGTWDRLPDLPTPRDHLAAGAVGDRIVVATGRQQSFSTNTDLVEVYDVSDNAWREGTPAPTARGGTSGAATPRGLVVVGGEASGETFEEVERYDPRSDTWTALPDLPTPRHGLCAATLQDGVHAITGGEQPGFAHSRVHEVLTPPQPISSPASG